MNIVHPVGSLEMQVGEGTPHTSRLACTTLGVWLAVTTAAQGAPRATSSLPPSGTYAISQAGTLVGYSRFVVEPGVRLDGRTYAVINSQARVRLAGGSKRDVLLTARLMIDEASSLPAFFYCRQVEGQAATEVECLFSEHTVAQKIRTGRFERLVPKAKPGTPAEPGEKFTPLTEVVSSVATDTPNWLKHESLLGRYDVLAEHYALLLARLKGSTGVYPCYDPALRSRQDLRLTSSPSTRLTLGSQTWPAQVCRILDNQGRLKATAWTSPVGQLLKLEQTSGLTLTLSDERVEARVDASKGLQLPVASTLPSDVWIPNAAALKRCSFDVAAAARPGVLEERSTLGWSQRFLGTRDGSELRGRVEVTTAPAVVRGARNYPSADAVPSELAEFLVVFEQGSLDELKSKGSEVAWKSRTSWDAARKVNTWINESIREGSPWPSAMTTLEQREGDHSSRASLEVSLLRSMGIPARVVHGLRFVDGSFEAHDWVEAWLGSPGWVALDPTTGEEGTMGAARLALSSTEPATLRSVSVREFEPHPPARLPFFNNELKWPIGEERVYRIVHGGKEVGREIAAVRGLVREEGREAYAVECATDCTLEQGHVTTKVALTVEPRGLPLHCTLETGEGTGSREERRFRVDKGQMLEDMPPGGGASPRPTQGTPYSEGAYVVDPQCMSLYALVVGQIPNLKADLVVTAHLYSPRLHTYQELNLRVNGQEKLSMGGQEHDTWRLGSSDGITFFVDKVNGAVLRIEQMKQDLVLELIESKLRI